MVGIRVDKMVLINCKSILIDFAETDQSIRDNCDNDDVHSEEKSVEDRRILL